MKYFCLIVTLAFVPCATAQVSSGTAFAVAPGLLVTNQHVVDGCASIDIVAADGRRSGAVVDADPLIDLALLRVTGIKGATARLRTPRSVRLGESVMVFGFPLSGSLSSGGNFTSGIVSGLRGLRDAAGEIQITAPVQPGNSGGPVLDAAGLVVGVVQAKLDALRSAIATGDIPQNVNFAISLDVLADFLAKNRVTVRDAVAAKPLDTASVAEFAQSFTYRVECRGKEQRAVPPQSRPPATPSTASIQSMQPGTVFRDCEGCPEMVVIPPGRFVMGSPASEEGRSYAEGPQYEVTIARAIAVGKFEVTSIEWEACVTAGGCQHRPGDSGWGKATRPIINVSWNDAKEYAKWLSSKTSKTYRLLTEAEWEYAARAGSETRYPWGYDVDRNRANFDGSGSQWSGKQTAPVGSFEANKFGLHDMIGNVSEWTEDCWKPSYFGSPNDGSAWTEGDCRQRVLRGGTWNGSPLSARAAVRFGYVTALRVNFSGFRVARTDF